MQNPYSIKQASSDIEFWYVVDTSGNRVGACSSREDALRIAALANNNNRESSETQSTVVSTRRTIINKAVEEPTQPLLFEWYSSQRTMPPAHSFLKSCCRGVLRLLPRKK
jgi:hypothetical protein